jgi:hypothetical protein
MVLNVGHDTSTDNMHDYNGLRQNAWAVDSTKAHIRNDEIYCWILNGSYARFRYTTCIYSWKK